MQRLHQPVPFRLVDLHGRDLGGAAEPPEAAPVLQPPLDPQREPDQVGVARDPVGLLVELDPYVGDLGTGEDPEPYDAGAARPGDCLNLPR